MYNRKIVLFTQVLHRTGALFMNGSMKHRLYEHVQTYWISYTYYLYLSWISSMLYIKTYQAPIGFVWSFIFLLLLVAAGVRKVPRTIRYSVSLSSLLAFFVIVWFAHFSLADLSGFIFYIPLLYTLLFPNPYSSLAFGIGVTYWR